MAMSENDTAKARDAAGQLENEAVAAEDQTLAGRARAILIDLHVLEGNVQQATTILYDELQSARERGDWSLQRLCLEQLGDLAVTHNCPLEAIEFFTATRDASAAQADWGHYAVASLQIASEYRKIGEDQLASVAYADALKRLEDLNDRLILYRVKLLRILAHDPEEQHLDELLKAPRQVTSFQPLLAAGRALREKGRIEAARQAFEAALTDRQDSQVPAVLEAKLDYASLLDDPNERRRLISEVLEHTSGPKRELQRLSLRARALFLKVGTYSREEAAQQRECMAKAESAKIAYERERLSQQNQFQTAVHEHRRARDRARDASDRQKEEERLGLVQRQYLWAGVAAVLICLLFAAGFAARSRYRQRLRNLRVETDRKHRAELQEKLNERSTELEAEMDRRLELERAFVQRDRFEAIGALTSGVAHDFNNLMTVVQSVSETVSSLARERLSDREREMMSEVLKAAKSGSEITRQLLQLTRGSGDLFVEPIVIANHLREIRPLLVRTLGEAIDLHFDVEDPLATIRVESAQLTTSLINLCSNSRDAIVGKGTVRIRVETLAVEDRVYAQIAVADNGTGMTPEQLVKATKPLYSTKGPENGSGLGLPIVQRFANRFEGELDISSSPTGTAVRIRIPAMTSSLDEDGKVPNLRGLTVMVVDDKVSVLNSVTDTLRHLGCEAHAYQDVATARIAIESGNLIPDLMLADIRLPDHSENETLADWVAKFAPSVSVVLMSGLVTPPHIRLRHNGEILSKPFSQMELATALERALDPDPVSETGET